MYKQVTQYIYIFALLLGATLFFPACNGGKNTNHNPEVEGTDTTQVSDSPFTESAEIKLLSEQIAKDSSNAELFFTRANMYIRENNLEKAAVDFADAILLDSTNASYYLAMADMYFQAKELIPSIRILEAGNKHVPNHPDIQLFLGKTYFYGQKYDDAQQLLEGLAEKEKENASAYFWLGMLHYDKKEPKKAIIQLKKAVQRDAELYNAQMMLGKLLSEEGNADALKHFDACLRIDAASIEAHYAKALFLQNSNQTEAALAEYQKIIMKDPQYADAHYNSGFIHFEQANYEKARSHFNMAVRVSPALAKAYYMRGQCSEKLGDKEGAVVDYKRCLNFEPQFKEAIEGLNRVK